MKVKLERTFPMPAPADATWAVLSDVEVVAGCMPGAKITGKIDDAHYNGTVSVKLGPANLTFRGEIEVRRLDAATRTLQLAAKGTDKTGASFASMDLTARVDAGNGDTSALVGDSEAEVGGKAAAFGGRMIDAVSDQILKQFAANFAARVAASVPAPSAGISEAVPAEGASGSTAEAEAAPPPQAAALPPPPSTQLNGFALLWAILRDWLRGLFSRKSA